MGEGARSLRRAAREARQILAEAMGALQEDPGPALAVQEVTAHLADAVGVLFAAERTSRDQGAVEGTSRAREQLSACLAKLQDVRVPDRIGSTVTQAVARALSTLHDAAERRERAAAREARLSDPPTAGRAVKVEVTFLGETNFYVGFSGDLSDGGLFVATYELLPVGSNLTVEVTLPDEHRVVASGRVAWVREEGESTPGMGVHLEPLPETDMKSIRSFMRKREPIFWME
ncbi:MAG: TIGR02266 family protein [Deltaproteobacteria bacterium]|nr:TIGR02266 family protein [Deltaproteobacteria bacterium]